MKIDGCLDREGLTLRFSGQSENADTALTKWSEETLISTMQRIWNEICSTPSMQTHYPDTVAFNTENIDPSAKDDVFILSISEIFSATYANHSFSDVDSEVHFCDDRSIVTIFATFTTPRENLPSLSDTARGITLEPNGIFKAEDSTDWLLAFNEL